MKPEGVWADLIRNRFRIACKRLGFTRSAFDLDCSQFRRPSPNGQLDLL
jgi:hypothetical protein